MSNNIQCENCLQKPLIIGEELAIKFHEYVNNAFKDGATTIKSVECDGFYKLVYEDGSTNCVYDKNTTFYQYCIMKDFVIYTILIHYRNELNKVNPKLITHINAVSDFLLPIGYYLRKVSN